QQNAPTLSVYRSSEKGTRPVMNNKKKPTVCKPWASYSPLTFIHLPRPDARDSQNTGARFGHVQDNRVVGFGMGDVAGLVGNLDLEENLEALVVGQIPVVGAVVLQAARHHLPRALRPGAVVQTDRVIGQVFILGGPVQGQRAAVHDWIDIAEHDKRRSRIHFDPDGRLVAAYGGAASKAAAVGDHQANSEQAFAGQIDFSGTVAVGILRQALPGLPLVGCDPNFHLADAAGPDLVNAV